MRTTKFSRREFLEMGAAATASLATQSLLLNPEPLLASPVPASDRIRFGMVGVGMQGTPLLAHMQAIVLTPAAHSPMK